MRTIFFSIFFSIFFFFFFFFFFLQVKCLSSFFFFFFFFFFFQEGSGACQHPNISMTRQFLEKRGFQKTPFPISVGLQTFFAIGLDNDMVICKVSAPNINVNIV